MAVYSPYLYPDPQVFSAYFLSILQREMAWLCGSLALSHVYPTTITQGILFTLRSSPVLGKGQ